MSKYFGTDGIRGLVGDSLNTKTAYKVGRYLGYYYTKIDKDAKIVIGKDTRLSSDMLEASLAAGASASGANVYLMGFCPTPSVAFIVNNEDFKAGIMISASHNPYFDNGIKVFNHDGHKISNDIELEIERYLDNEIDIPFASRDRFGRIYQYDEAVEHYLNNLEKHFKLDLTGYNIAIDCANGSAYQTAEKLLKRLNATCILMNDQPNGMNINTNCGSTHPEDLQKVMETGLYDLGLAFDGDADRLIAVNNLGELIDGDYILYIISKYLKDIGALNKNTVVTTVMANLGLFKALDKLDINYDKTFVGDKYVFESMNRNDYILGGEQSGHIILKKHATTGDGLLTALMLLEIMKNTSKSVKELSEGLVIYPQLLVNQRVVDKQLVLADKDINLKIEEIADLLGEEGRILVRPSGTESLVRVMVEAKNSDLCHKYVYEVIDLIKQRYS